MAVKDLETLVSWYDAYESATYDARKNAERDRDYYDGKQWTGSEEAELKKRGQPILTFNRIASKVDFVLGMERQTRTDPKAWPRNPGSDEGASEAATDALRYIGENNEMDEIISRGGEDLFIEGVCGGEVRVKARGDDVEIAMERIPYDRLFWDPRSRFHDFRDARYYGMVIWMDFDDALEEWPDKREVLEGATSNTEDDSTGANSDRPNFSNWVNKDGTGRQRLKIVQIHYRSGYHKQSSVWYVATCTRSGFLEEPQESPYKNEHGETIPSLILRSAKMDRDNNRYGLVRMLISAQDEINKRRSKSLHILNQRQTLSEKGAVDDVRRVKQELAKPDGHIEINPSMRFELLPTGDMASGHLQLQQEAMAQIDAIGANAAMTGKDERTQSGRAIQARQQGGFIELTPFFDGLRAFKLRMFRHAWYAVRQFWTDQKWVRVTDDAEKLKWVTLNRPVTMAEALQEQGQQIPPPEMLSPEMVAQLQQVVAIQNNVAQMDMDIILDEAPDTVTLQSEQFEMMVQLAQVGVQFPPQVYIEASALRNKQKLIEQLRLGGATPEEAQAAQQAQQQAQQFQTQDAQLELAQKAAEVEKTQAETAEITTEAQKNATDAGAKQVETQLAQLGFDAAL